MNPDDSAAGKIRRRPIELIAGALLFFAAVAVMVWQNSRLAVLWDLSYILENATRISLGQLPYRDFPFPYAPLTFLIQAALIKLTGRVFWHTIAYAALLNGLSIVLTWRINIRLLPKDRSRWIALLLVLPLAPLGVYSIFPHPFYDPDCTCAILLAIYFWVRAEDANGTGQQTRAWSSLLAGMALALPLFVKQNTGLLFLGSAVLAVVILLVLEITRRGAWRHYLLMLQGASVALIAAFWWINWFVGIKNYWHWTIQFAASRRTPARAEMVEIYSERALIIWLGLLLLGAGLLWFSRRTANRRLPIIAALLMAAPFVWPAIYLLRDSDSSERAERLLNTWPVLLIFSLALALATLRRSRAFDVALTCVLVATINGAFMSQQLWGSTYAIWPLYSVLLAMTFARLQSLGPFGAGPFKQTWQWPLAASIVLSLLISGSFYLKSHERLDYANLDEGELRRSSLAPLKGLATRGDWVPAFEELVGYTDQHIPREEGIMLVPGEDLFYFTTGRTPKFPVLMFDHTVNPYSPAEIVNLARERDIRWLIVKQEMQDEDEGIEKQRDELTEVLEGDFEEVESLGNYGIYHRRDPNKKDGDDDDGK